MPTLNELLDIDLTYQEILDQLEEETDGFTVMDGEVAFSSQFEFETAKTILENHYEEVKEKGLDVVNDEGESAFTLEFSSPFVDDFDFPDEVEESLNEDLKPIPRGLSIIYLPTFEKSSKRLGLNDDDLNELEEALFTSPPEASLGSNVYKFR